MINYAKSCLILQLNYSKHYAHKNIQPEIIISNVGKQILWVIKLFKHRIILKQI